MGISTMNKTVESEARNVALNIRGHDAVETGYVDECLKAMHWSLKVSYADAKRAILQELEKLAVRPALIAQYKGIYVHDA